MKSFYLSLRLALLVTPTIALILARSIALTTSGAWVRCLISVAVLVLAPTWGWRFAMRAFRALFAPAGWREAVIKTKRERGRGRSIVSKESLLQKRKTADYISCHRYIDIYAEYIDEWPTLTWRPAATAVELAGKWTRSTENWELNGNRSRHGKLLNS